MSKSLLSLVKPLHRPRRRRSRPSNPLTSHVIKLLKSDGSWESSLEQRLSGEEDDVVSDIAQQVFDKINDGVTAVRFFNFLKSRPYTCPIQSRGYSSLLKVLAGSRMFENLERIFDYMEGREVYPSREAVQVLVREYSNIGNVDSALTFYYYLVYNIDSIPDAFTSNSLLTALVLSGRIHLALYIYHQITKFDSRQIAKLDLSSLFSPLFAAPSPVKITKMDPSCSGNEEQGYVEITKIDSCEITKMDLGCCRNEEQGSVEITKIDSREITKMDVSCCRNEEQGSVEITNIDSREITKMDVGRCRNEEQSSVEITNIDSREITKMDLGRCRDEEQGSGKITKIASREITNVDNLEFTKMDLTCGCGEVVEGQFPVEITKMDFTGCCNSDEITKRDTCDISCTDEEVTGSRKFTKVSPSVITEKEQGSTEITKISSEIPNRGRIVNTKKNGEIKKNATDRGKMVKNSSYRQFKEDEQSARHIPEYEITKTETKKRNLRTVDDHSTGIMVKALCDEGRVEAGRRLISDRWGPHCIPSIVFYNMLIAGFAKKGNWRKSKLLLTELYTKGFLPNMETYAPIVSLLSRLGRLPALLRILSEMNSRALPPNTAVYNSILHPLLARGDRPTATAVLAFMTRRGRPPDTATFSILISAAARSGDTRLAETLVLRLPRPDLLSSTSLIHAFFRKSEPDRALHYLLETRPDPILYGAVVHGLISAGQVEPALRVHGLMASRGLNPDLALYNSLLTGLWREGMFSKAENILSEMLDSGLTPDEYVSATVVRGFLREGRMADAKRFFETAVQLGRSECPGGLSVVYNAMLKGLCGAGEMEEARVCFARMRRVGVRSDVFTYSILIDGFVKAGGTDTALSIFGGMMRRGCMPNVVTYTSIVEGFCRRGETERAEAAVDCMRAYGVRPNMVTFTVLIHAFSEERRVFKAVKVFRDMLAYDCRPTDEIYKRLFNVGSFYNGFERSVCVGILVLLCKYGRVEEASELCRKMKGGFFEFEND